MDTKPINPLIKHFRRPSIYFKLPSQGKYWPENTIDLPVTGEIPIFPMTSGDEITLKTPDALMNGSGIISVIQSCCPNIRDAWGMPSIDVDATLIAIRIASFGNDMAVTAKCPHCNEEHDYDVDLSSLTDKVKCPDYSTPVEFDGLKILLKPQLYSGITKTNITQFEEQKIIQTLNNPDISDEIRNSRLKESMKIIMDLNEQLLVDCTDYIETEDGSKVRDPGFIKEYYRNADGGVTKAIEKRLADHAAEAALPKIMLGCSGCTQQFEVPLEFDYARFFDRGS